MKLFKYESYQVIIEPEALMLKPFKVIWARDKTKDKSKAMNELAFVYFFTDPRSDYQFIIDEDERVEAIKEGEGLPSTWKPDAKVQDAIDFYGKFKSTSALLLEDTRILVQRYRGKLLTINFDELEIKDLKIIQELIKQSPSLIKDLDEVERTIASEIKADGGMRGQGEKTIFEDNLEL